VQEIVLVITEYGWAVFTCERNNGAIVCVISMNSVVDIIQ